MDPSYVWKNLNLEVHRPPRGFFPNYFLLMEVISHDFSILTQLHFHHFYTADTKIKPDISSEIFHYYLLERNLFERKFHFTCQLKPSF